MNKGQEFAGLDRFKEEDGVCGGDRGDDDWMLDDGRRTSAGAPSVKYGFPIRYLRRTRAIMLLQDIFKKVADIGTSECLIDEVIK